MEENSNFRRESTVGWNLREALPIMENMQNWLRVEQRVYEQRLSRMKRMIEANAPAVVIYNEDKYILAAWHPPFLWRTKGWLLKIYWSFRTRLSL